MVDRQWKSRRGWRGTLAMSTLLLGYVLLSVKRSDMKPLWFDELSTLNVATQPTIAQMLRVEVADATPPLFSLLLRPCLHAFGVNALALRLPAMLSVGLALVCAYVFVRRRFGTAAGLLTAALLLLSPVADYGVEARPYALLMGLTMLALVLWQRAAASVQRRVRALVGLGVTVFCVTITHSMGVIWVAIPLFAGEAARWRQTRRVDRAMLLAIVAGLSGFAITLVLGRETQQVLSAEAGNGHSAIAIPTAARLLQALHTEGMLPALVLMLLLGLRAWWMRRKRHSFCDAAPMHEWVAASAFAITAGVVFLFTEAVTHYFWARYLVPGTVAGFVLVGMLCGYVGSRKITLAALVIGVCLIGWERQAAVGSAGGASGSGGSSGLRRAVPALLSEGDPSLPIVIGKPFFFPQIWWYSRPETRARLHYLGDAPMAAKTTDFVPELALIAMHNAGSKMFPPDSPGEFLQQNKRFLLWHHSVVQGCWQEDYLRSLHYVFTPVASDAGGDEVLYDVRAPEKSEAVGSR